MNFKRKVVKRYSNGEITVIWKPHLCNHSTICFAELPDVFKPADRPWVKMDGASTKEIQRVVDMCPTQALEWEWDNKAQQANEESAESAPQEKTEAEPQTIIRIVKGGPALVRGRYKLIDTEGKESIKTLPMSICRCGHSKKHPVCDGSHTKIDFND